MKCMRDVKFEAIGNIFKRLVGKRLINIFYQPMKGIVDDDNMFIVNFGSNKLEYSIHAFTFLRIRTEEHILLTSADEYNTPDCEYMDDDLYYGQKGFEKSMIPVGIKNAKDALKKARVISTDINGCGDVHIAFDNNVILELFIDCLYECSNGYILVDHFPKRHEYYRIMDCTDKSKTIHYIVSFMNGDINAMVSESVD